jgi:AraC-like DNA-binding protein
VRGLLRHLRALPPGGDTSLASLAAVVGLSPGRLMHVFTESIGVPLRPYLLWLKLQRAAAAVSTGVPLGEAAHLAGFADAAHMSRTFRRTFGVPPSALRPSALQPAGTSRRHAGP